MMPVNKIENTELTEADIGRWVEYWPTGEKGRIKSWNKHFIFVVYRCSNNWDDYQNYTAASTHPKALKFIETPQLSGQKGLFEKGRI